MSSKKKAIVLFSISLFAISGCNFWNRSMQEVMNDPFDNANSTSVGRNVEMAPLQMPRSIIVCRSKQCAPTRLSMSKEYIYNSLVQMLESNNGQRMLICAADSGARNCYQNYISLPITVGITPAYMYIDSVKIEDVQIAKGSQSVHLMLNYNVTFNGQTPECTPNKTHLYVRNSENIIMEDQGYKCKMTTIGTTTIKTLFLVDYIDLDYGFIGGFYSIGLSGPAYGGGTGYMLFRLSKIGYPTKPNVKDDDDNLVVKSSAKKSAASELAKSYLSEGQTKQSTGTNVTGVEEGVQVFPVKR